jgi:hypothetical protein
VDEVQPTKTEDGLRYRPCGYCGMRMEEEPIPATGSVGLAYEVNNYEYGGPTCTVTGIGSCVDTEVFIPQIIDGYTVADLESGDRLIVTCSEHIVKMIELGNRNFYSQLEKLV